MCMAYSSKSLDMFKKILLIWVITGLFDQQIKLLTGAEVPALAGVPAPGLPLRLCRDPSTWSQPVLRFLLWLVYLLADSTAIFALGHLSLSGTTRDEHRLVYFWAPFLLLHLGGPDNMTAYALQDNQLWLRHLQILNVQVLGAAYVMYKQIAANGFLVLLATVLMFAVGLVKLSAPS